MKQPASPALAPTGAAPAASQARSAPSRWILDGPRDLALMVAPGLWIFPSVFLLASLFSDRAVNDWVAALGATGHHLPGLFRAYGDRALFARFRLRFVVAPLFIGGLCVLSSVEEMHVIMLIAFAWGVWHGIAQTYGFARIYGGKAGAGSRLDAHADMALLVTWFLAAVVLSPVRLFSILDLTASCGLPLPSVFAVAQLKRALVLATAVATLGWLLVMLRQWRAGAAGSPVSRGARAFRGPGVVRVILLLTSIAFFWFANFRVRHLLLAVPLFELFHDAQYLTIVWVYNRRRVQTAGSEWPPLIGAMFKPNPAALFFYVFACVAYGAVGFYPRTATLGATVGGIVAASQLLHFYYDGFIWKVREVSTGTVLGIANAGDAKPVSRSWPRIRHALLWSLFLVPYVGLWGAEEGWGMSVGDRLLGVAPLVEENAMLQFSAAELRWTRGQRSEALAGFRRALEIDPSLSQVRNNLLLSLGELADRAWEEGDAARLAPLLGELSRLRPSLDEAGRSYADQRLEKYGSDGSARPESVAK